MRVSDVRVSEQRHQSGDERRAPVPQHAAEPFAHCVGIVSVERVLADGTEKRKRCIANPA
jgi:hypothetical protein